MKITTTILSIPPYISTTWDNISSLHVKAEKGAFTLVVILQNRTQIEVPNLGKSIIDAAFEAHANYAEETKSKKFANSPIEGPFNFTLPLKADGPIDSLGFAMQHNPEQANLPPIPQEALKKITLIARAFGLEDASALPETEPNCNCIYCQVAKSLKGESAQDAIEEVTAEDLTFRNWDIKQTGEKLYCVTNPLDSNEYYNVFLGTPVGCTCGSKSCEHIKAVLNS